MSNRVVVSLGSNIDKEKNLPAAVDLLRSLCKVVAVSSVYETVPVGLEEQPNFWNAAVLVETELDAVRFRSEILGHIEDVLKRVRTIDKNAPRTIDADISLFNQEVFELDAEHHIPDPELLKHAHVAVPVAEICPKLSHPETGDKLAAIATLLVREMSGKGIDPLRKRTDVNLGPSNDS